MLEGWIWPPDGWIYVQESWIQANAARGCKPEGWIGIGKVGYRLKKPGNCTDLVKNCLTGRLDPEIVGNCTNLVRNYFTGRLDPHKFGKELPYKKAGSMQNCSKLHEFGKELPYRKARSAQMW